MDIEFKTIDSIKEYVLEGLENGRFKKASFVKSAVITAHQGSAGEKVSTIMSNGLHETDNVVKLDEKTGNPGWIVTAPGGEQYIVEDSVFCEKYEKIEGTEDSFKPKGKPIVAAQIDENISFPAPWGGEMNIAAGGWLVFTSFDDIYGIQKDEFSATYKQIEE